MPKQGNNLLIFLALALVLLPLASAGDLRLSMNGSTNAIVTDATYRGHQIEVLNYDLKIINITQFSNYTCTQMTIYNGSFNTSQVLLNTTILIGDTAYMQNFTLYAGNLYYITPAGGSCTQTYNNSVDTHYPKNNTYIIWRNASYWGGTSWDKTLNNYIWYIESIYIVDPNPAPVPEFPSVTLTTNLTANLNTTLNPYSFGIWASAMQNTTDNWNCTMSFNNTVNQTILNIGALNGTANTKKFNLTYDEKAFNINVTCNNFEARDDIVVNNVFIDSIKPTISITSKGNNTNIFKFIETLDIVATCSDTNLFSCNMTTFKLNNNGSINSTMLTNVTITATKPSHTLNISKNVGNWTNGMYMTRVEAWDSHTSQVAKNISVLLTESLITVDNEIKFYGNFKVNDSQGRPATYFYLSPDLTKHKMKLTFPDTAMSHRIDLVADNGLYFISDSQYLGHFFHYPSKHWIDFISADISNLTIIKNSENNFTLILNHPSAMDETELESIGDGNTLMQQVFFNITDGFIFYARDFITNNSIANLTITVNSTPPQTKTTTAYNITFNVTSGNYRVNISTPNYVMNTTYINFSTGGNMTWNMVASNSLYLLIFDELTNQYITRNVTVQVINFENTSYEYTTETGSLFQSNFATGSYTINYYATNYALRSYYTTITGSDTQTLRLYLLNSTPSTHTYKNIQVADESGVPIGSGTYASSGEEVTNATVELRRFFVDCNCYRVVEMAKTGDNGQTFVFAQLYDGIYKVYVNVLGSYLKVTPETRFDTRDVYLTVPLIGSAITDYLTSRDVYSDISLSEATKFITYSWVGTTSVRSGTLSVSRVTPYNEYPLFNQTVNASTSAISFNVTAYENTTGTIIAIATITTVNNQSYVVNTKTIDWTQAQDTFGLTGVFLAVLIIMTMALVGYYNPVVSVMLSLMGIVGARMLGLIYMDLAWMLGLVLVGLIYAFKMRT